MAGLDPRGARRRAALAALAAALGSLALGAGSAGAQADEPRPATDNGIDVVQIEGLLDPHNAALVDRSISRAEDRDSSLLVFQVDSGGAVGTDVDALTEAVGEARVPIAVWIGPSGADARGGAALLALSAPFVSVAQGAGIGAVDPPRLDEPEALTRDELTAQVAELQEARGRNPESASDVVERRVPAEAARDLGIVDSVRPTIGEFIVSLHNQTIETADGPVRLSTADVVGSGVDARRRPNQVVRFAKLDLTQQLAHTLGSPWVAYVLFVIGVALLIFEFFTAGVGIAGGVGAIALIAACYGFSHLPAQWWAIALLAFGMIGLAIDLQAGGLGTWTFLGAAALVAGSVTLYGGSSRLDPSWWVVVLTCGGAVLFMVGGMTAMVRARFSTPTVGREELVGEMGDAAADVAPDGVVRVRDALWRARTNRATPIHAGDRVRVVAVDGIVLEVEPEAGGARDYRERARGRRTDHDQPG
jgi:membrane-bound serine protease (ClpP class)